MADPTFAHTVDVENRLITVRLIGREPSAHYADRIIAVYRSVPELWRYNRLIDHRKFRGMIQFEDIKRMSAVWDEITQGHPSRPRIAFVTRSALTQARIAAHDRIFPTQVRRAFTSLNDALSWVLMHETVV